MANKHFYTLLGLLAGLLLLSSAGTVMGQTFFYSTGSGSPTTLTNWVSDTITNTGNPTNFTTANQIFVVRNSHIMVRLVCAL